MKRLVIVAAVLLISSMTVTAFAKDSGNKDLNRYLAELSQEVSAGVLSKSELKSHISSTFGVSVKDQDKFEGRGVESGELYLIGLIHKASGINPQNIASKARYGKGSWKDAIYFFGTTPDELDAMRKADEKSWKRSKRKNPEKFSSSAKSQKTKSKSSSAKKTMTITTNNEVCECQCSPKK